MLRRVITSFLELKKIYKASIIFKQAFWQYKWQILATTILGFISGILGGLGVGMLIPLFSFITQQNGSDAPNTLHHFISQIFSFFHLGYNLPLILALMLTLFTLKAILVVLVSYINETIAARYVRDTGSALFKKTLNADWEFLMNQKVGYLSVVIFNDVALTGGILVSISDTLIRVASLAAYAVIAVKISSTITTLSLLGGILVFAILKPLFYRSRKLSKLSSLTVKKLSHLINESLIGSKTLKSFAVEPAIIQKSASYFEELKKVQIKGSLINSSQSAVFEPVSLLFVSALFLYSYKLPNVNIASFVVIVYLIQKMYSFIQAIQARLNSINSSFTYLDIMLNYKSEVQKHQEKLSGNKPFKFKEVIDVQGVAFAYPGTESHALSNIDFTIQKGEMIGLIGPSGAGKTTLVDLFLQLLTPQKGIIKIDDVDIASINLSDWRKHIGYVSQDIFLLNDTVEANIRFYNDSITHEDIVVASKMANIYDFIQELPDKFETQVGERGVKLSGGQRQRVSLARVLAKKPSFLILDEATSSLDNESESLIQKAISDLKGKVTVLVIAHRLSTIMNSDRIMVIEDGKLIETGTPDELIKNIDSYLYKSSHIKD